MPLKRYCPTHGIVDPTHTCPHQGQPRWPNGSTRTWRKTRAAALNRDHHTCWCGEHATEVHHITDTQLQSVCHRHNPRGG